MIIKEFFEPVEETNINTVRFMKEISTRLTGAFLKELRDTKKSTCKRLSSIGGELSWDNDTEADIKNGLDVSVANDPCESTFGVLTDDMKRHQKIGLTHVGGVAMSRKTFASGLKKVGKNGAHVNLQVIQKLRIVIMFRTSTYSYNPCT